MNSNKHFSKEIFISNWKRLFFIPIVIFTIMFFGGPYNLYMNIAHWNNMGNELNDTELMWALSSSIEVLSHPIFLMFAAIAPVMAVFAYLYNNKSAYMMHAFPVTRKALYISNILSGILMVILPALINAIIMTPIASGMFPKAVAIVWMAVAKGILEIIFFFGLGTLIGMITGSFVVLPILYFIANVLYCALYALILAIKTPFFFGFYNWGAIDSTLSPVVHISTMGSSNNEIINGYIFVIALVGILFLFIGYYAYKKRNVECAGDPIPVSWLRPVFRWGVSFCASVCAILLFSELTDGLGRIPLLIFYIVGFIVFGLIMFIAVQMILKRSFKIFNKRLLKEYAAMAIAFSVFSLVLCFDPLGREDFVPEEANLAAVGLSVAESDTVFLEGDDVAKLLDIHKDIVDNKSLLIDQQKKINSWNGIMDGDYPKWDHIEIVYTLKNGKKVARYYTIIENDDASSDDIIDRTADIVNSPRNVLAQVLLSEDNENLSLYYMELYLQDEDDIYSDDVSISEKKIIYDAMKKDIEEGRAKKALVENVIGNIMMDYENKEVASDAITSSSFLLTEECVNTKEALTKLNYLR